MCCMYLRAFARLVIRKKKEEKKDNHLCDLHVKIFIIFTFLIKKIKIFKYLLNKKINVEYAI